METPVILSAVRTPIGKFQGGLAGFSAPELGGRIVAEVIVELLRNDPTSLLSEPDWQPDLAGADGRFGIADLLKYAGVV